MKVGIIGCGVIGSEIALACETTLKRKVDLVSVYDIKKEASDDLSIRLDKKGIVEDSLDNLFKKSELVVEAASAGISRKILEKAVKESKSVMIMSTGGLIDSAGLLEEAGKRKVKVYFPSGAICGIDGLKAAKIAKIDSVTLTTRKPVRGLEGAPYLKENNIDINSIKKETIIFQGTALEAVKAFPKNINVSSVLSLVGIGAKETKVKIVTSPEYTENTHEVEVKGDFGKITTKTENVPSEKNPKTSKLAILSAIATLKSIVESVKIGT